MKKKGNIWRFLACLLAVAIFFVTTAFSLRGETMATPDNPLKELQEESGSGKATMLSDYLPKSQEIAEELRAEEAETEEDSSVSQTRHAVIIPPETTEAHQATGLQTLFRN